jgi:hypothetical protein
MLRHTISLKSTFATCVVIGLLCATQISGAATPKISEPLEPANLGEYTQMLQYALIHPSINFCISKLPAEKKEFETEYGLFKDKARVAMAPLATKAGAAELSLPAPDSAKEAFKLVADVLMIDAKKQEPKVFCAFMVDSMRKISMDSLRQDIESKYPDLLKEAKSAAKK